MKWKNIAILAALVVVIICIGIGMVSQSLWFYGGMVMRHPYDVYIASSGDDGARAMLSYAKPYLPTDVSLLDATLAKWAYVRTDDAVIAVGRPKVSTILSAHDTLRTKGWRVERLGLIVYASKPRNDTSVEHARYHGRTIHTLGRGIAIFGKAILNSQQTPYPSILATAKPQALPEIHAPVTIMGRADEHAYEVTYANKFMAHDKPNDFTVHGSNTQQKPTHDEVIVATKSTKLVHELPQHIRTNIEQQMQDAFGFERTSPRIMDLMARTGGLLKHQNKNTALVLNEATNNISSEVVAWIQAEEAHRNPVQDAFALPDGTIGYEIVPGRATNSSTLTAASRGCRSIQAYPPAIHYCNNGKKIVLATSEETAKKLVNKDTNSNTWNVSIGRDYISGLRTNDVSGITAQGAQQSAHMRLYW